ncbi:MAG TPA: sigma 54-interacting transcriptional regulator [Polyangia bacterium]|nr:sigma 54-interacting transcriptional regulator [Polyangia bacterium]
MLKHEQRHAFGRMKTKVGATTISHDGGKRPLGNRHRLIVWANGAVQPWFLPATGSLTVGRAEDADIRVASAAVSREHARIHVNGATVTLEDLDSRNSTRLNGERIAGRVALGYGDIVSFGDATAILEAQPDESSVDVDADEEVPPEGVTLEIGDRTIALADPIMLNTFTQIRRLAQSPLPVLIVGETGAGKDLAAAAMHAWSKRGNGPSVSINCASLPESLVESELFGHERGAFSGADREKVGLLEAASGGTLFLDEIGDLPPAIQPKLLRALESQKITRLGSVRERAIDVRIVTATNRDLEAAVTKGLFRLDLYYRISAAVVYLPPLRARLREVPLLARRFLDEACQELERSSPAIVQSAMQRLLAHDWPGNVRELKNLMGYLAALAGDPLTAEDVKAAIAKGAPAASISGVVRPATFDSSAGRPLRVVKEELERQEIEAALAATAGNKTRAAQRLGMPLRTFTSKLKRYGLPRRE